MPFEEFCNHFNDIEVLCMNMQEKYNIVSKGKNVLNQDADQKVKYIQSKIKNWKYLDKLKYFCR